MGRSDRQGEGDTRTDTKTEDRADRKVGAKAASKTDGKTDRKNDGRNDGRTAGRNEGRNEGGNGAKSKAKAAPKTAARAKDGPPARVPHPRAESDGATRNPAPAPPTRTAGDVLLDHLHAEAAEFLAQVPRVRAGAEDSAHRMRVAARRMRSSLRTCAPLVEDAPARALAVELRWVADCLAGERDNEVLLERLLDALGRLPVRSGTPRARAAVERRLRGGLATGHTAALRALDSADFAALTAQLAEPGLRLPLTAKAARPAAKAVPKLASAAFGRLARGAAGLPLDEAAVPYPHPAPLSGDDDEAWHRVRILGKRARYAADLCAPEFGPAAKDLAKRMKAVTESLGTHQDAALAADVARELAVSPRIGGAAAFVLGELYMLQRFAVAEARHTFATLWPALRGRLDEVPHWGD